MGSEMCIRDSRLGIAPKNADTDTAFVRELFIYLKDSQAPWPEFWHDWQGGASRRAKDQIGTYDTEWTTRIKAFEPVSERPKTETPNSLLYEEIGEIWQPIAKSDDWSAFKQKTVKLAAGA